MRDVRRSTESTEENRFPVAGNHSAAVTGAGRESALCQQAFDIAVRQAIRVGFRGEGAEDCAIGFVCQLLVRLRQELPCPCSDAWLKRCAVNYARNVMRGERRQKHYESCFTELCLSSEPRYGKGGNEQAPVSTGLSDRYDPEVAVIRRELRERIEHAAELARLTPSHRRLLREFYASEQTAAEIGRVEGRTANAIRQELWALRHRLRAALEAECLDYVEAISYRAILSVTPACAVVPNFLPEE